MQELFEFILARLTAAKAILEGAQFDNENGVLIVFRRSSGEIREQLYLQPYQSVHGESYRALLGHYPFQGDRDRIMEDLTRVLPRKQP